MYNTIVNTIGTIDDLIENTYKYLLKFQELLQIEFQYYSSKIYSFIRLDNLITRTGKPYKNKEWYGSDVIDLSTMKNGEIFINDFSKGEDFTTNIKSINNLDLVYGSIRPYFKKAGFALEVNYIAGSVYSFNSNKTIDYLWILACITSSKFHDYTSANSQGTKMPIINWDTFVEYNCPYDKEMIEKFNNKMHPLFKLAIYKSKQLRKLKVIKQSLLSKYF